MAATARTSAAASSRACAAPWPRFGVVAWAGGVAEQREPSAGPPRELGQVLEHRRADDVAGRGGREKRADRRVRTNQTLAQRGGSSRVGGSDATANQ